MTTPFDAPSQKESMRILQLCKKFPYPLKDGEAIAVTVLSQAMQHLGCEVSLLAMNTRKHHFPLEQLPAHFNHYKHISAVEVDNRIKPAQAFRHLFGQGSYHIARFISPSFQDKLRQLLEAEQFDVVQLETPYLAPYIPTIQRHSRALIAMRAHNVEHEIWERIAEHAPWGPKRWYLAHLSQRLRAYEAQQLSNYGYLAAISERDLKKFRQLGYSGPASVVPIGVDSEQYHPDYGSYQRPLSISFIGSLDWMPNQEGLRWFLDEVWGLLLADYPRLELHVAGRNPPNWLLQLKQPGVIVHGEVPSAAQFINRHSLTVVPLLSGSGMRAKILEGMALGKVVLTTSIGLEGISAQDRRELLVADTPAAFVAQVGYALEQKQQLEVLGRQARAFVLAHYDNLEVAQHLLRAYREHYRD